MPYVKVKGFQIFKDHTGKVRCYHRNPRARVDLKKYPLGSAGFFAECTRITEGFDKGGHSKPGTLGLLIEQYRAHPSFTALARRTRADYQRCFDYLDAIGDTPLVKVTSPLVVKIRDRAAEKHGRRFANYLRTVLALLFAWGRERGYVKDNPAAGIKGIRRPKDAPQANRPWSDTEREAVEAALPAHMRLAVALMMYCGLDPQDAVKLPRTAIKDDSIDMRRGKTGEGTHFPLPQRVRDTLAASPKHSAITLCANSYGKPWTVSGFRASWGPVRKRLEREGLVQPGLTLKGLRHTVATILAEMGHDERTIADMLGQKTTEMARHYSRRADKSAKGAGVVVGFDAELNKRRTKIVKPG
ncbi:MAG: tyrosine-type recombinase/integrase [Alphaproteobacteria bacterium]|nr:tyrosine-type recombinase/integrase [Alphaproteobacteria bacterium]